MNSMIASPLFFRFLASPPPIGKKTAAKRRPPIFPIPLSVRRRTDGEARRTEAKRSHRKGRRVTMDDLDDVRIHVIAAEPGWFVIDVFDDDEKPDLFVDSPIVAWRIETRRDRATQDWSSYAFPITPDGEAARCAGYLRPDGAVVLLLEGTFDSLDDAKRRLKRFRDAAERRSEAP
jgi:hypothetical protein